MNIKRIAQEVASRHLMAEEYDFVRDRLLEERGLRNPRPRPGDPSRRAPRPAKRKSVKSEFLGGLVLLNGTEYDDGFIAVDFRVPNAHKGEDYARSLWRALDGLSRRDRSIATTILSTHRRYQIRGAEGNWPEVSSLDAALRETDKLLQILERKV